MLNKHGLAFGTGYGEMNFESLPQYNSIHLGGCQLYIYIYIHYVNNRIYESKEKRFLDKE